MDTWPIGGTTTSGLHTANRDTEHRLPRIILLYFLELQELMNGKVEKNTKIYYANFDPFKLISMCLVKSQFKCLLYVLCSKMFYSVLIVLLVKCFLQELCVWNFWITWTIQMKILEKLDLQIALIMSAFLFNQTATWVGLKSIFAYILF